MRKNSIKNTRVNTEVQRELSNILRGGIKDPRVAPWTSVVAVEVAPDLKTCKAYISVLGDEKAQTDTLAGLKSAEGYIRRELAHRLNMRNTPEIRFILDQSIEYASYVQEDSRCTKGWIKKEMRRMQNKLAELLEGKTSVAIGGHVRPDGDCVGCLHGTFTSI